MPVVAFGPGLLTRPLPESGMASLGFERNFGLACSYATWPEASFKTRSGGVFN